MSTGDENANPIERRTFDDDVVEAVANCLGSTPTTATFSVKSRAVYRLLVPDTNAAEATRVTLWPSLRRVDASNLRATAIFTEVETVDLVGTVEAQFRRASGGLLIVAFNGKVIVKV